MTDQSELTSCRVVNKQDGSSITLCTQWYKWGLQITVFTTDEIVMTGQMKMSDVDKFAENLSKTREEYLELTRRILSGKEAGVEYVLTEMKLRWKKGPWNYGIIDVAADRLEGVFPGLLGKFLDRHTRLEETVDRMKKENEELIEAKEGLNRKVEEMIEIKDMSERDIYKRFITVLNSKKEKIRELASELSKRNGVNRMDDTADIFEAETEDSEDSGREEEGKVAKIAQGEGISLKRLLERNDDGDIEHRIIKRQISDSDGIMSDSECEGDGRVRKNCKRTDRKEVGPSTSKGSDDTDKGKGDCGGKPSVDINDEKDQIKRINFDSEESEEDMFD